MSKQNCLCNKNASKIERASSSLDKIRMRISVYFRIQEVCHGAKLNYMNNLYVRLKVGSVFHRFTPVSRTASAPPPHNAGSSPITNKKFIFGFLILAFLPVYTWLWEKGGHVFTINLIQCFHHQQHWLKIHSFRRGVMETIWRSPQQITADNWIMIHTNRWSELGQI